MAPNWWKTAQAYEKAYTDKLVSGEVQSWIQPGIIDPMFFPATGTYQAEVTAHAAGRVCLEVGSSIQPAIGCLTAAKERRVVEPMGKYFPDKFPSNVMLYPVGGEEVLPKWAGEIDGLIYSRNVIDHAEHPMDLFDMILRCAAPECWLLHWSDIWHWPKPDEGHRNITTNPFDVHAFIAERGFDIKHTFSIRWPDFSLLIDFGCLARKK